MPAGRSMRAGASSSSCGALVKVTRGHPAGVWLGDTWKPASVIVIVISGSPRSATAAVPCDEAPWLRSVGSPTPRIAAPPVTRKNSRRSIIALPSRTALPCEDARMHPRFLLAPCETDPLYRACLEVHAVAGHAAEAKEVGAKS